MEEFKLIITDVTRMSGDHVCVAGLDEHGNSVRPVLVNAQIPEHWLYDKRQVVIHPFSVVVFKPLGVRPEPPHTEDVIVQQDIKRQVTTLAEQDRIKTLHNASNKSVIDIFGAEIHHEQGYYVREGEGNRSLGTIKANVLDFTHTNYAGSWDYRLWFSDRNSQKYRLKVTDLSFRYFVDDLREKQKLSPDKISKQLSFQLSRANVFLRIGLARPTWNQHPHCCFLQVTGVYTFPDYLDGRCFADFKRP